MTKIAGSWFGKKTAQIVEATDLIGDLKSADPAVRRRVAEHPAVSPEMLFLLAGDPSSEVRRIVAGHAKTPSQISPVLAADVDVDVREVLMHRLLKLLPDLPPDQQGELYMHTVKALETLARDEILSIREALANTLKDVAYAPYSVVQSLAQDLEETVAGPVLQLCAALTDEDLIDIIANHAGIWAIPAVARRNPLSAAIAGAIVKSRHGPGGGMLLDNVGAVIDEVILEEMVEHAAHVPEWQPKLAARPKLPGRLALRLAEFVEESVIKMLHASKDFDAETRKEVASVTRRRLDYLEKSKQKGTPAERALLLFNAGQLSETIILDAISWDDRPFVMAALAYKLKVPPALIEQVFATKSARAVISIAWRAGVSMRCALQLQRIAGVVGREVLNARNGKDYPLAPKDMLWQLELVGVI